MDFDLWFQTIWDVLQADDEACMDLIRSAGGRAHQAMVSLVEGELSTTDALAYARTLCDLGRMTEAREVLWEVVNTAFGMFRSPVAALA
ncbi:MAG: hypothetical protein KTR31_14000 [Myxococcales bacterium]|nr:hypothetical protein [Myxococcales bacterium]